MESRRPEAGRQQMLETAERHFDQAESERRRQIQEALAENKQKSSRGAGPS